MLGRFDSGSAFLVLLEEQVPASSTDLLVRQQKSKAAAALPQQTLSPNAKTIDAAGQNEGHAKKVFL